MKTASPTQLYEAPHRSPHTSASPSIARWHLTILVSAWKVKDLRGVSLPQAAGQIPGGPGVSKNNDVEPVEAGGQVIATSETYERKQSALNGVESVKENAPGAATDDQTGE